MSLEPEGLDADAFEREQPRLAGVRRANVEVTADEHKVVELAAAALARHPDLYQRGNLLAHVLCDDVGAPRRARAAPRIAPVSPAHLRELSTAVVYWFKVVWDKKRDEAEPVQQHPPQWAIAALHARGRWPGVRPLEGISEVPVLRPDGSVWEQPGYDAATGICYLPAAAFPPVPAHPTRADAVAALAALREPFADFPFAAPAHRATALAALLTPLARPAFRGCAPLFLVDANTRGSGKSLLADVIGEVVAGRPMARMALARDDDEMRKTITAMALGGAPLVLLDNIAGTLGGAAIEMALTGESWRGRVLGESREVEVPFAATWFGTGNNVQLSSDMARRTAHVRIESPLENPEERQAFRHPDLLAWVREHRGALVAAGLTLLAAYLHAGAPDQRLAPWGSFDGWTRVVRQALVWVGEVDPGDAREQLREESDAAAGALGDLVAGWSEVAARFNGQCTAAQALAELARDDAAVQRTGAAPRYARLREALAELCPSPPGKLPSARQVGNRLRAFKGRVTLGRCLQLAKAHTKEGAVWHVIRAGDSEADRQPDSPESPPQSPAHHLENAGRSASGESGEVPRHLPHIITSDFSRAGGVETESPESPESPTGAGDGDPAWSLPPEEDF